MEHVLPPLPYPIDSLAPHYSREMLEYHHGKHHNAYVVNLNGLQKGTEFESMTLEDIIKSASGGIYNNAAQIWNHTFFWNCMKPQGGAEPTGALADAIKKKWGSYSTFRDAFVKSAVGNFGSGWTWLVKKPDGSVDIVNTGAAGTPLTTPRQGAAHGGRVGARLLHRLSQSAPEVRRDVPGQAHELGLRPEELRMKRPRRTDMRRRLLLQAGTAACALPTWAQSPWPAGPVRFIVPFPAGSAPDVMARLLGARLSEHWGKAAIVDNKPGASGVIGMSALKAAPADGHTFGFVQGSAITTAPATIKGVGYDYARDFVPVTLVSNAPFMLAVAADAPWQTLDELLKAARAKPESVEVADNGAATAPHLAAALLGQAAGVKFLHVHYQGGQQALQGLLSGQVKMQVETYNVLAPLVQGGRVRILASMSDRADPGLEALPLAQKAAPGAVAYGWFAVIARKGTEPRVVEELNRELRTQLEAPDVTARFRELGAYPRPTTPAELDAFVAADRSKWLAMIDRLGLKPE